MKLLRIYIVSLLSLFLSAGPAFAVLAADDARPERENRLRASHATSEILVHFAGSERFRRVPVPAGVSVENFLSRFEGRGDVLYAEPNYIATAYAVPNDEFYSYQWHFDNANYGGIHMESAWDISTGSGVTVAILDTGVAYENYGRQYVRAPDLAGTTFVAGYDFVNNDDHPNDDNGHGTHVAGTVAQSTNNTTGVAGIAYNASVMPIKVLGKNGSGSYADVADGIYWAVSHGAQVINLSLGGPVPSNTLRDAVAYAYNNGVTVVAASGNDNAAVGYPAAYDDYVLAVGATRYDENRAPYSNYGASLDIVAPGGDMTVDQNGDTFGDGVLQQTFSGNPRSFGYYFFSGTSMATPHVAGVAALVIANGNATTPDEVRNALQSTADPKGAPGRDDFFGHGLLNAAAALGYVAGPPDNPPTISITAPLNGATVSGAVSVTATASDDIGVSRVNFYINGSLAGFDTSSPYAYAWNTTVTPEGSTVVKAEAVDTTGQTTSNSVSVLVDNINDPPVANAGADQTVIDTDGNGVETITLNGSASYDPDGVISAYEWREGGVVLGSASSLVQSFTVGAHTIVLKVTDNGGATSTDSVVVTIQEAPVAQTAYLSIDMSTSGFSRWRANANVTVLDEAGNPIGGASVVGVWSGDVSGNGSGVTDSSGGTIIRSDRARGSGSATFTVTSVSKNGVDYVLGGETSDSIAGGLRF